MIDTQDIANAMNAQAQIISKDELAKHDLEDLAYVEIKDGVVIVSQIMGSLKYAVYFSRRATPLASMGDERDVCHACVGIDTETLGVHVFEYRSDAMVLASLAAAGIMMMD